MLVGWDLALQSDGKLVVAGHTNADFAVARLEGDPGGAGGGGGQGEPGTGPGRRSAALRGQARHDRRHPGGQQAQGHAPPRRDRRAGR